jgi:hypothetical protein
MIEFFKKLKNDLNSDSININIQEKISDKERENILSSLKISGFKNIYQKEIEKNIKLLILDKDIIEETVFLYLNENKSFCYKLKNKKIAKEKEYDFNEIDNNLIKDIFKNIDHKHVFISGEIENNLVKIENIFKENGIKIHIFNI